MERSLQEKKIIEKIVEPSEELPYRLIEHNDEVFGKELMYDIPDEDKEKVLTELWPFVGCPSIKQTLWDIHEEAYIHFKDCFVIRWNERNVIVSPAYFHSGGTMIDLVNEADAKEYAQVLITSKERLKK